MANWTNLTAVIAETITDNGNQEITGAVLRNTLNAIVGTVGANATFAGVATPTTNPGVPDGPVFYLAGVSGVYSNFGVTVQDEIAVITNTSSNSWLKTTVLGPATTEQPGVMSAEDKKNISNNSKNAFELSKTNEYVGKKSTTEQPVEILNGYFTTKSNQIIEGYNLVTRVYELSNSTLYAINSHIVGASPTANFVLFDDYMNPIVAFREDIRC